MVPSLESFRSRIAELVKDNILEDSVELLVIVDYHIGFNHCIIQGIDI